MISVRSLLCDCMKLVSFMELLVPFSTDAQVLVLGLSRAMFLMVVTYSRFLVLLDM